MLLLFGQATFSIRTYLGSVASAPVLGPIWYIRTLLFLFVISPILISFIKRFRQAGLIFLFVFYIVTNTQHKLLITFFPNSDLRFLSIFGYSGICSSLGLLFFSFGIAIALGIFVLPDKKNQGILPMICSLILMIGCIWGELLLGNKWMSVLHCLMLPLLCYSLFAFTSGEKWPVWITGASFSVFLLHKFVTFFLLQILPPNSGILVYLLDCLSVFLLSLGLSLLLKRTLPRLSAFIFGGR